MLVLRKTIFFLFLLTFCFLKQSVFSQSGTWTWMHGQDTIACIGNSVGVGIASPSNEPPALYAAAHWTDLQGRFWIYGGLNIGVAGGIYADLWMFDPTTQMWTLVKGSFTPGLLPNHGQKGVPHPNNHPGSRTWGQLTWVDLKGDLWLYGGSFKFGSLLYVYSDLWKYEISSNTWTWMSGSNLSHQTAIHGVKGIPSPLNFPGTRNETTTAWTDKNGDLWFMGGESTFVSANWNNNYNDLWKYNIKTNEWTWMKGDNTSGSQGNYGIKGIPNPNNEPRSRNCYSSWKDLNNNFWIWGGGHLVSGTTYALNDLWKYDINTNQWTWVKGSDTISPSYSMTSYCKKDILDNPRARVESRTSWIDAYGNFWMFGGFQGGFYFNELWHYNVSKNIWTFVKGDSVYSVGKPAYYGTKGVPTPSNIPWSKGGAVPFKDLNGDLWMFGGMIGVDVFNDLWRYQIDTSCLGIEIVNPVAAFSADSLSGCVPFTVNFTNNSNNSNAWLWNFGDGNTSTQFNPTHTYSSPGQYTVTLTAIVGNGAKKDTLTQVNYITVSTPAIANFIVLANPKCANDSIGLSNTSTNSTSFIWDFGNGSFSNNTHPSAYFTTPGNYNITLIAQNSAGCNDTLSQLIDVFSSYTFTYNINICSGSSYNLPGGAIATVSGVYIDTLSTIKGCDSLITTNLFVSSAIPFTQNISICSGTNYTLPSGNITNSQGIYTDTIKTSNGCDSIIITNLTVKPSSTFTQNITICADSSIVLPDGITVNNSGTYSSTIIAANGCDSVITTTLNVNPLPVITISNDTTIAPGDSAMLFSSGGVSYLWIPSIGLNSTNTASVIASPDTTTIYCVIISASNGCKDFACVKVKVELPCPVLSNLSAPNAFSPNGDGVNDVFCLNGWKDCIISFKVVIYNRWGEEVFFSTKPDFCWDGIYENKLMEAQVFVYSIEAVFLNSSQAILKKGNISLIR